ncbi:histidine kinase [Streptomyces sp. NPDC049555]|uniref:sensor histidine kinase n=1 Tax=unclassified Streptomyces TaxID=2593676 RepID=UPI003430A205
MVVNPTTSLRRRLLPPLCGLLAAAAVVGGVFAGPAAGWKAAVPMVVAVLGTLALAGLRARVPLLPVTGAVALSSALGTAVGYPPVHEHPAGLVTLVEMAAVLLLVCLVARFAPLRQAVVLCTVLGLLASTMMLRLQVPPTVLEAAAQSAFFCLGAVAAAAVGGYLRAQESRRLRSVHQARRVQRLQLARDLHDFVAHDVSGIVVLAQAAQVVAAGQPEKVMPILQQIEAAGLQALGSMDRTVHMLDGAEETSAAPAGTAAEGQPQAYGLPDIADVAERFRTAGRCEVELDIDLSPEHVARVPREVASTAHRVVVEALTNVRRHAPTTPLVRVSVLPGTAAGAAVLTVRVANRAPSIAEGGGFLGERARKGGSGLAGLAERAEALGGTLGFGGRPDGGWEVTAVLPLATGRPDPYSKIR